MNRRVSRVCFIRHGYFPQDPRVRKEVNALLELGYEVDVVCLRSDGEISRENWNNARIFRVPISHKRASISRYLVEYIGFFLGAFLLVSILQLRNKYALVHVNTMPDFLVFSAVLPRLMGVSVILDMHEFVPELIESHLRIRWKMHLVNFSKLLEILSARFATGLIAVSPLQAGIIGKRVGKDFFVLPNVPDDDIFKETTRLTPSPTKPKIMVTHGSVLERYGIQTVIHAIKYILPEQDVRLHIIGDGEYRPQLAKEIESLKLGKVIHFFGQIPLDDIPKFIQSADLGIVPILSDGYMDLVSPNKLFEYISLSIPVLASDLPGIRTFFQEGEIQFFKSGDPIDLAKKCKYLFRNQLLCNQMVERAYQKYQRISWKKTKKLYQNYIQDQINN